MNRTVRAASSLLVLFLLLAAIPSFAVGPALLHPDSSVPEYVSLPFFDWDDYVSAPYAGSYQIQIDDNASFGSPLVNTTIPAIISYYSPHEELPPIASPGVYHWRVRYVPVSGSSSSWSESSFSLYATSNVFTVVNNPTWQDVKDKVAEALVYADGHTDQFVEIRLPSGTGDLVLTQPTCPDFEPRTECPGSDDPPSQCEEDEENDFLFYIHGHDNVIVNGMNRKVVLHAQRRVAGFFFAQGVHRSQLKDVVVDYASDSLSQFGGEVVAISAANRQLTVEVDPSVYGNAAELQPVKCGFFVDAEHGQRIGRQGVSYDMTESWQTARIGSSNSYRFTDPSPGSWNLYAGEAQGGGFLRLHGPWRRHDLPQIRRQRLRGEQRDLPCKPRPLLRGSQRNERGVHPLDQQPFPADPEPHPGRILRRRERRGHPDVV